MKTVKIWPLAICGASIAVCLSAPGCVQFKRTLIEAEIKKSFNATMTPGTELEKVADGFYSYRWLSYRTNFIVTSEGVIVIDPLNRDAARGLAREIARVAPGKAITHVIYSHYHRDHVSGAAELPGKPIILAHANTARDLRARALDDVLPPTETFAASEKILKSGKLTLRLLHTPGAHTDGMLLVHIPGLRILYEVDILWPRQLPPAGSPDLSYSGTQRALEKMLTIDFDVLVPGHADIASRQEVEIYRDFLRDLDASFRRAVKSRGLGTLHEQRTFSEGASVLGKIFFDVEDDLRPKYAAAFENFDTNILPTTQWAFWHFLMEW